MNNTNYIRIPAAFLVIIMVVGVVAAVGPINNNNNNNRNNDDMKAIVSACYHYPQDEDKELCVEVLTKFAPNGTKDIKTFVEVSIQVAIAEMNSTVNYFLNSFLPNTNNKTEESVVKSCIEVFNMGIREKDEIADSLAYATNAKHVHDDEPAYELQRLLTSLSSYMSGCLDNYGDSVDDFIRFLENRTSRSKHLVGVALSLAANLAETQQRSARAPAPSNV